MTTEAFLSWFQRLDTTTVIFLVLSIVGIVLTIYYAKKANRTKKPLYCFKTVNIISKDVGLLQPISVFHKERPISNFSTTKIAFWNGGNEVIRNADVPSTNQIRVRLKKGVILDYNILKVTKDSNDFLIERVNESECRILFEFIDTFDGVIFELYHSGTSSEDVEFIGEVIGVNKISRIDVNPLGGIPSFHKYIARFNIRHRKSLVATLMFLAPVLFNATLYLSRNEKALCQANNFWADSVLAFGVTALYWTTGYLMVKQRMPKYFEEIMREKIGLPVELNHK